MKSLYKVIRKGSAFNSYGPTPDQLISTHRSESAALKGFERCTGQAIVVDPQGVTIASRMC